MFTYIFYIAVTFKLATINAISTMLTIVSYPDPLQPSNIDVYFKVTMEF